MQQTLFKIEPETPAIPGLSYLPDFIGQSEEKALLDIIDKQPWLSDLKRCVQHYGYKYDYKARNVSADLYLGPLPDWLAVYAEKLYRRGIFKDVPDQIIINEYQPGQGIAPHIDCVPCFAETIASLSLSSACVMNFAQPKMGVKADKLLEARSLLILSEEARYHWMHGIAPRKADKFDEQIISRQRRVSLTFRKTLLK